MNRFQTAAILMTLFAPSYLFASGEFYAGGLGGVSTLSADGRSIIIPESTAISLYKPENGPAISVFLGRHFTDYLSIQGNYVWNRNDLTLTSASFSSAGLIQYELMRTSSQHSVLGDLLLYFRNRKSFARPYLSVGTGIVELRSTAKRLSNVAGSPTIPPSQFTSAAVALRVAVGIDLAIRHGWAFRYTFSETARSNAISAELMPRAERGLKNFQSLFGFVKTF